MAKSKKVAKKFSDSQIRAMEAIFELSEAVTDGELSIGDLVDVVKMAVNGGHDTLMIVLQMTSTAVKLATHGEDKD